MKTSYIVLSFLFILFSCEKDQINKEKNKGILSVKIGLFVTVNEVKNELKSTSNTDDFLVNIINSNGEKVLEFSKASEMPDEIELVPGQYYVISHSNNNLPAAFDNPYYYGKSELFTISSGETQTISVNCELANTIIAIIYSERLKINYTGCITKVSTSAGFLEFNMNETREGYFQPLPVNISVNLSWQKGDGSTGTKTLTGSIPLPVAKKKYEIHIDAGPIAGMGAFQILVNNDIIPIEIVSLNDDSGSQTGPIDEGELLITEIMYDPVSMSDNQGEWFEIYNNSDHPMELNKLIIKEGDDNKHIVNTSYVLNEKQYYVFARSESAVPGDKYVYGSAISLNNSGSKLELYNSGNDGSDGSLVFSVDFGNNTFPKSSGSSIILSPLLLNPVDGKLGTSWCKSVTKYYLEDTGTPGSENDPCL